MKVIEAGDTTLVIMETIVDTVAANRADGTDVRRPT